ncbi:MAG: site-specific integrase [Phycisphaerales bacterium]|nr:site-specific integrase [Phycisphaerales bacterium]
MPRTPPAAAAERPPRRPPAYRLRAGYTQAIVTLTDSATGKRRDYWLGEYGSPESRELYYRLLADYESLGRRLPDRPGPPAGPQRNADAPTVNHLVREYWRRVAKRYLPKRHNAIRATLRLLRRLDGATPLGDYGPRRLRLLQEAMVAGDASADPPRRPWSRSTVNDRVRIVVAVFRWGAAQEMLPAAVAQALAMVEPLKRGRTRAAERRPVRPAPGFLVEATLPHLATPVRAMVELQLLTGARPGEIVGLRGSDLERDEPSGLLVARLDEHKTAHLGRERTLYFGPEAERVLRPFLGRRPPDRPLFSPADAEAERLERRRRERRTPEGYGNGPGTNRRAAPARAPGEAYTPDSYRRAIEYACARAFPPPDHLRPRAREGGALETHEECMARLTPAEHAELRRWGREHLWRPNQLRHSAATRIRREFGLEAAQLVLGHSSAEVTDAVYAERDEGRVAEVLRRIG